MKFFNQIFNLKTFIQKAFIQKTFIQKTLLKFEYCIMKHIIFG